jgi:hypothetical protein
MCLNPFLFIRGLSCPICIQASLSSNCFKLIIPGFPHNCLPVSCGDISFLKKILGLVLAWKSGLKVPLLPLGCSCVPSANYSSEWFGRVRQPSADRNDRFTFTHHYCQQRAITPDPESLNSNKKGSRLPLLSAEGWSDLRFSKAYSSKHKRAKNLKKLQLLGIILRFFIIFEISMHN